MLYRLYSRWSVTFDLLGFKEAKGAKARADDFLMASYKYDERYSEETTHDAKTSYQDDKQ